MRVLRGNNSRRKRQVRAAVEGAEKMQVRLNSARRGARVRHMVRLGEQPAIRYEMGKRFLRETFSLHAPPAGQGDRENVAVLYTAQGSPAHRQAGFPRHMDSLSHRGRPRQKNVKERR